MKKYWYILMLCLPGCDENGSTTRYERLEAFHTVELNDVFEVALVQDSVFGIRITGEGEAPDNVVFRIDTGILRIENRSRAKWLRPKSNKIKLFIHADSLRQLLPNETCRITSVNPIVSKEFQLIMGHHPKLAEIDLELNTGVFYYWNNHQCGGKVTLRGETQHLRAYTFGLMSVDADDLVAQHAIIENNSKGDCHVRVEASLRYSIRGVGNIYLSGEPEEIVAADVSASGRLIRDP